jgi:hypothetical protein
MADNPFLKNFLKMRHELERPKEGASKASDAKKGSAIPLPAQEEGISLATIIEETPAKSTVLKYLRQRIEFLTADD